MKVGHLQLKDGLLHPKLDGLSDLFLTLMIVTLVDSNEVRDGLLQQKLQRSDGPHLPRVGQQSQRSSEIFLFDMISIVRVEQFSTSLLAFVSILVQVGVLEAGLLEMDGHLRQSLLLRFHAIKAGVLLKDGLLNPNRKVGPHLLPQNLKVGRHHLQNRKAGQHLHQNLKVGRLLSRNLKAGRHQLAFL